MPVGMSQTVFQDVDLNKALNIDHELRVGTL